MSRAFHKASTCTFCLFSSKNAELHFECKKVQFCNFFIELFREEIDRPRDEGIHSRLDVVSLAGPVFHPIPEQIKLDQHLVREETQQTSFLSARGRHQHPVLGVTKRMSSMSMPSKPSFMNVGKTRMNANSRNVFVISPEERQSDQPAWVPVLLSICEAELEEVSGHEREQHQTRRQLPIPNPLQT